MDGLSVLTPREMEILLLLLASQSNKSTAVEIFISEKIIEFYVDHIHARIGARLMAGMWTSRQERDETREIPS